VEGVPARLFDDSERVATEEPLAFAKAQEWATYARMAFLMMLARSHGPIGGFLSQNESLETARGKCKARTS